MAGESSKDRRYARDIIATALLNRLQRRRAELPVGAVGVVISAEAAFKAAQDGQEAIHQAEALLHEHGEKILGDSVSESAYASLDATKAAFENATAHAAKVAKLLEESRLGIQRSQETAATARRGAEATQGLEEHMARFGRGAEGRAATQAAHAIAQAADDAAGDARRRDAGHSDKTRDRTRPAQENDPPD